MREITNQRARGSANLVKYAPIYQWRAYQLPLLPTGMTIKPANCSDAGQRRGIVQGEKIRVPGPTSVLGEPFRAREPVIRSAFISHKFDMIREEYDNGHQVMGNCRTDRSMFRSFNVLMMVYIGVCDIGVGLVVWTYTLDSHWANLFEEVTWRLIV